METATLKWGLIPPIDGGRGGEGGGRGGGIGKLSFHMHVYTTVKICRHVCKCKTITVYSYMYAHAQSQKVPGNNLGVYYSMGQVTVG